MYYAGMEDKIMTAEKEHVYVTIERKDDGKVIQIHRDVCTTHPAWVHEQMGTHSEGELQAALDSYNAADYAGKGRDCDGVFIEMLTTDELIARSK